MYKREVTHKEDGDPNLRCAISQIVLYQKMLKHNKDKTETIAHRVHDLITCTE